MRIDEIDQKHKDFKKVILDHNLTEEQLDELVPLAALAGTAARVAGGALVRGAGAVGRGLARGARSLGRGMKKVGGMAAVGGQGGSGSNSSNAIGQVGKAIGNLGTDLASQQRGTARKTNNNNQQSLKTNTAQKLSQKGSGSTIGTQSTQGTQGTQQTKLARGQEFAMPVTDPNKPNQTMQAKMKVKNVSGSEVELTPSKRTKGLPKTVKYNKKDLALN